MSLNSLFSSFDLYRFDYDIDDEGNPVEIPVFEGEIMGRVRPLDRRLESFSAGVTMSNIRYVFYCFPDAPIKAGKQLIDKRDGEEYKVVKVTQPSKRTHLECELSNWQG